MKAMRAKLGTDVQREAARIVRDRLSEFNEALHHASDVGVTVEIGTLDMTDQGSKARRLHMHAQMILKYEEEL